MKKSHEQTPRTLKEAEFETPSIANGKTKKRKELRQMILVGMALVLVLVIAVGVIVESAIETIGILLGAK